MSPFGRGKQSRERSPEERERARLEREMRRAEREGRPLPEPPAASVPGEAGEPAWDDAPEPVAHDESWDYGDPVTFDAPNGHVDEAWEPGEAAHDADQTLHEAADEHTAPATPEPAAPSVPDARSRAAWDDTGAWDAHPPAAVPEPPVEDAPPVVPASEAEQRPAWDDTGAWEAHPPAAAGDDAPADEPEPTLGQEIAAVDRGWFEDDDPPAARRDDEPGQETVEWDVLANRPKQPPAPPTGPGGVDSPTVEWDVLAQAPKAPVGEDRPAPSRAPRRAPAASSVPSGSRFGDEHERPVPTRRMNRTRTLPPPPPPPGERRRRGRPGRGAFLAVAALLLAVVVLYLVNALFQPLHDQGTGRVQVTIPRDSSAATVGDILEREGVVDSSFFFQVRTRLSGKNLQAGVFQLKQGMPYGDAIDALAQSPGAPPTVKITIPEGKARRETAPLVQQAGIKGSYLAASERSAGFKPRTYGAPRHVKSLEGFLFPATYELRPGSSSADLVAKQVAAFRQNIKGVSMAKARKRNLSTFDVLTIASMVEREATLPRERRLIAAVIYNRLKAGMPLGIDATIRFATRNWSRPLKQSELAIDSPYNTRRHTGLPPGPIGSPGLASIKAAAAPANVPYLYYVVKPGGNGAHAFSSTDAQFQKDVAAYNRARAGNGGKDPSGR